MKDGISFFFPAYNEEGNLEPMVRAALETLPRFAENFEVIIVDDGSRDGTAREGEALAAGHPHVRYIRHPVNRGYGEAVRTGLTQSTRDLVFYTDGDRQFDVGELALLLEHLPGSDIVAGYRLRRADPWHRLFIAWTYNRVLRLLFGLRLRDVDCAFKLLRRQVIQEVSPGSGGAFFSAELILRARHRGFRVTEVGVTHYPRALGRAKGATPAVILRTFREMFALRLALGSERRRQR